MTDSTDLTDSDRDPERESGDSEKPPRLLTPAEAAAATGRTRKQITGMMDRGSLRVVKGEDGTRRVPRAELVRVGLLAGDGSPSHPAESDSESARELVIWRDMFERERAEHAVTREQAKALRVELASIASAGPIRAMRLRRRARQRLDTGKT